MNSRVTLLIHDTVGGLRPGPPARVEAARGFRGDRFLDQEQKRPGGLLQVPRRPAANSMLGDAPAHLRASLGPLGLQRPLCVH